MKIGLFFGSFNPLHTGHLIMAEHIANFLVDQVWFVVSPQSPFKNSSELLSVKARSSMIKAAIKDNPKFKYSDIELNMPVPSYTIDTLQTFKKQHPNYKFSLIMGYDNFKNLKNWKNGDQILKEFKIFVYKRSGFSDNNEKHPNVTIINAPLIDISATHIRNLIRQERSIQYLVPDAVFKKINAQKFYSK